MPNLRRIVIALGERTTETHCADCYGAVNAYQGSYCSRFPDANRLGLDETGHRPLCPREGCMTPDDHQALREWQDELLRRIMAAAHAARERGRAAIIARARIRTEADVARELAQIEQRHHNEQKD